MMDPLFSMGSSIANHLWQSTGFAFVVWLSALLLRRSKADCRYQLWLAASLKFAIPFSLLIGLASQLPQPQHPLKRPPIPLSSAAYFSADFVTQPFSNLVSPAKNTFPTRDVPHAFSFALIAIWLCGFGTVILVWIFRWRRAAAILDRAVGVDEGPESAILRRIDPHGKILLRLSEESIEPGIFGIFRSELIWPKQLSECLQDEHIEAILTHEAVHVRRHDNLMAAVHMFIEAIFWFNPVIWWIGSRLVQERELACDESVISLGTEPEIYAESLLKACRFCIEMPSLPISGITGSDLDRRVHSIMKDSSSKGSAMVRITILGFLTSVIVGTVCLGVVRQTSVYAQILETKEPRPSFEVATIKASAPSGTGLYMRLLPAAFATKFSSLVDLVQFGYRIRTSDQIVGASQWMKTELFDLQAKPDSPTLEAIAKFSPDEKINQSRLMLQSLLAERFHLRVHTVIEERPVYALVLAKGGSRLSTATSAPSASDGKRYGSLGYTTTSQITAKDAALAMLTEWLSKQQEIGNRVVIDETGLTGRYDFVLSGFPAPQPNTQASSHSSEAPMTSLFTLLPEQLGLRLLSRRGPVEVLVIDDAEQPTQN